MFSFSVENSRGDRLNLTGNPCYTLYNITGLNPPPATLNKSVNTTAHGSKINSVRIEERNIVIYLKPERNIENSRIKIYKYFPDGEFVTVYFSNSTRNVYISGVVETVEVNQFENPQIMQISIICNDPFFKDVKTLKQSFSDVMPKFKFPFAIPESGVVFSSYETKARVNIENTGDVDTGVQITLIAAGNDIKNPTIYDLTHGIKMSLNITMQKTDRVVIKSTYFEKTITLIRDGVATNAIGYMRPDSKWFNLSAGENIFSYECESGSENLKIELSADVLYSGV